MSSFPSSGSGTHRQKLRFSSDAPVKPSFERCVPKPELGNEMDRGHYSIEGG
jgi:hypothetical protein